MQGKRHITGPGYHTRAHGAPDLVNKQFPWWGMTRLNRAGQTTLIAMAFIVLAAIVFPLAKAPGMTAIIAALGPNDFIAPSTTL